MSGTTPAGQRRIARRVGAIEASRSLAGGTQRGWSTWGSLRTGAPSGRSGRLRTTSLDPAPHRCIRSHNPRGWWPLLLVALAGLLVGACEGQPKVPTIAGVVQAIEPLQDQDERYVLETGDVVINQSRDDQLYPPGHGSARIGDLLIVGMEGETTWYLVVPAGDRAARGGVCYPLAATGVDRGVSIDTDIGVRLPKTADFDRGPDTDGKYNEQPHEFCLDESGAIYAWV